MTKEVLSCPRCGATIGVTVRTNMSYKMDRTLFHDCPDEGGSGVPAKPDAPIPGGSDAIELSNPQNQSN